MFRRKIENKLKEYYQNADAEIIIIDGARQIGKSYIIRNTARDYFKNYVGIDLKSDFEGEKLFDGIKTTKAFYLLVGSLYGDRVNYPDL